MYRRIAPAFILVVVLVCPSLFSQQTSAAAPLITAPVNPSELVTLKGNTHPLARPLYDRGGAPPDLPMDRMLLVLKRSPERQAALHNLINQLQDKHSPNYHQWLTPEDFGRQFGASDQDVQTVANWLQSSGFKVNRVTKGRSVIEFSGNAGQVQAAFHTAVHQYAVNGEVHWANNQDPQIPAALAPVVAGVSTLHNFLKKPNVRISSERFPAKMVNGKPQTTFTAGLHALSPGDYAVIYGAKPFLSSTLVPGQGSSIALVARSNVDPADLNNFGGIFGVNAAQVIVDGPNPGELQNGDEVEAVLDASWAGAVASFANVSLVVSATTNTTDGVDLSELYIIDNNFSGIMSESFGTCEAGVTSAEATFISQLAEEAAAQGITYLVSTGDSGAEGCDDPNFETVATGPTSVNVLASSPFTLGVGGTMFNEGGSPSRFWSSTNSSVGVSALSYIPEDVWNESCTSQQCGANAAIWAGGGGVSTFFPKPFWQSGVAGIPNDGARDLPDVSLTAAGHDPYLLCLFGSCIPDQNGNFFFAGVFGTSASAPSFAGFVALVSSVQPEPNPRFGQANWVLYQLAAKESLAGCNASNTATLPASTCIFNDVTVGNNAVSGETNFGLPSAAYQAGVGYDLATGLGSVNVSNLIQQWNSVNLNSTSTTLNISPAGITHGMPVNVNVTVSSGAGVPSGDVSLFLNFPGTLVSDPVPGNFFTLDNGTVIGSTNVLPGGNYGVMAHYAGNGTFAPSDSAPAQITVNPEATKTALSVLTMDANGNAIPFTTGPYGSFVYLRADVAGTSGFGFPRGALSFLDNGNFFPQSQSSLNSFGTATIPSGIFNFELGAHSITADYAGDPSFLASNSAPGAFNITQAAGTMTVSSSGQVQGANLVAVINTTSGGIPPSGTVTFFLGGNPVGSAFVSPVPAVIDPSSDAVTQGAQGVANLLDTSLANGQYSLSATYTGDIHYAASTAAPVNVNVQPDFSFGASGGPTDSNGNPLMTLRDGTSGTLLLLTVSLDGFNSNLNFSCSGLPVSAKCTFSPPTVAAGQVTTLTLSTLAAASRRASGGAHSLRYWAASAGMMFVGIFLLGVPAPRRRALLGVMLCLILLALVGCGGGGGGSSASSTTPPPPPPTPVGNYSVIVTATSGAVSHSFTIALTVQ